MLITLFSLVHVVLSPFVAPHVGGSVSDIFTIYSGDAADSTPATMRFNLGELQKEDYSNLYSLTVLPSKGNYEEFFSNQKYITDSDNKLDDTFIPFVGKLKSELLEIVEKA